MNPKTAILLSILLSLSLCSSACLEQEREERKGIHLDVWVTYNNEELPLFQELTEEFVRKWNEEEEEEISIKVSQVPFGGLLPKIKTACQTHTTPDICRVDCAHVVPLAYGQAIVALDELESFANDYEDIEDIRKDFVQAAIDSNIIRVKEDEQWRQHLFGLPDRTNCVCLFRNLSIFREQAAELRRVGLAPERAPRTWEELIEYGKVLSSRDGQYGFAMDNSLWWTLPFFNCWGAEFLEIEDGRFDCVLDRPEAVEALTFKANLYQREYPISQGRVRVEAGAWRPGAISKDTGFINGMYAMIMTGPWNLKTFRDAGLDFDVNLIPQGPDGSSSNVGGSNLVVFKSCPYPEIAYRYLSYVTNVESQTRWCNALDQVPTIRAAFDKVDTSDKPALRTFLSQILKAKARPRVPNYDQLEEIINPEMELALGGKKSPKKALKDAVERINEEVLAPLNEAE